MSGKFVVRSDSYGECVYLRMFGRGRYGSKFGLVRSPAEATAFSSRLEAGLHEKPDGPAMSSCARSTPSSLMRPRPPRRDRISIATHLSARWFRRPKRRLALCRRAPSLINGRWRPVSVPRPLSPSQRAWSSSSA